MDIQRLFSKILTKIFLLVFLPCHAYALDTSVLLITDYNVTPKSKELITFGLPLTEGDVFSNDEIRVLIDGSEKAIYVESKLMWHWTDNSIRSITIQLQDIDMTNGDVTVSVTNAGSNIERLSEQPHSIGWSQAGSTKNNLPYPRVFAIHDPAYLATTNIVPPYLPQTSKNSFSQYQSNQFDNWSGDLDYVRSGSGNWLFDRSSAMFKAYLTASNNSDRVKFLKEAFLSKQFYYTYVRNDGTAPARAGGDGCWAYKKVACADGKYIQPQSAKLALALIGDDSQWDNDLIINMALQADLGWNQYATRDPYSSETEGFTERGAGMAGLAEIHAFEITADSTILSHMYERIASLKDMQQTEKPWDIQNGWTPKSGGFTHSFAVHEGNSNQSSAPLGNTNDRAFSAWMSENIADFLWQAYAITGNEDIPEMLRLLGNAIEKYGFTSRYENGKYIRKPGFTSYDRTKSCNTESRATDILYFASAYASEDTKGIANKEWWPYYSDTHAVEVVLPLALAYYFETSDERKKILQARIDKITSGWINTSCANVFQGVYRLWNWQHRSNSIATWQWVVDGKAVLAPSQIIVNDPPADDQPQPVDVVIPGNNAGTNPDVDLSGWYYVTNDPACSEGNSWHWQCGKGTTWVSADDLGTYPFVATCTVLTANGCPSTSRTWVSVSNIVSNSHLMNCDIKPSNTNNRYSCMNAKGSTTFGSEAEINSIPADDNDTSLNSAKVSPIQDLKAKELTPIITKTFAPDAPIVSTDEIAFQNVTVSVIDYAPRVKNHFWINMPDVNQDGCFDIYVAPHSDANDGAMYMNNCDGTFTYHSDAEGNYTQNGESPRITSRNMFGNWYGNPDGLPSFYGHDADGNPSAKYVISELDSNGYPVYSTKSTGCFGTRAKCYPLDFDGDGVIEMVVQNARKAREIVDIYTGAVITPSDSAHEDDFGMELAIFDLNNNGYPEIVNTHGGGYWYYDSSKWVWKGGVFTNPELLNDYHLGGNHEMIIDWDSDGDMDMWLELCPYDSDSEIIYILHENNGDGTFSDVSNRMDGVVSHCESYWTTYSNSQVADINLDGYPDIISGGETYGNNVTLYINDGSGRFIKNRSINFGVSYVESSGKAWVGTSDYDNDGKIDIIKTHDRIDENHASVGLFRNISNIDHNWLRVRTRGIGKNTDGLHTRLVFKVAGSDKIITSYQVGAFSVGYQNLVTHAGLADHEQVDLEVFFPHDGPMYKYSGIKTNQDLIIFYDGGITSYKPGETIATSSNN